MIRDADPAPGGGFFSLTLRRRHMSHEKESFFEFLVDDMVRSEGEAAAEGSF
jgi:hypothetical protein